MKKNLIWRLSKLPTVEELQILVKDGIITKEEEKDILFSSETKEDIDKKSLQLEIKFLRELVEKLSGRDNKIIIETIREIEVPYKTYPFYEPYKVWCGSSTCATANYTVTSGTMLLSTDNFSDISTF